MFNRKICIDIETTGMNKNKEIYLGHRIIEIGCVEIINRKLTGNNFHEYINPNQKIDESAFKIHRISEKFLKDKPTFSKIYNKFIRYINNSDIIVHNAGFDIEFINYEISKLKYKKNKISSICKIIDTLKIARFLHPGKKNNLNALCNRYNINTDNKKLHSALFDSYVLGKLYLMMTSNQKKIDFLNVKKNNEFKKINKKNNALKVMYANSFENSEHIKYLKKMKKLKSCLWIT